MVPTRPTEPLDNRVALETPEHVVLPVSLAGPGARGLAWLVDTILRSFIAFFVVIFALALGAGSDSLSGLSEGAIFLLVFLLDWAWFVAWELLDGGRSPGKRMLGLRVIRADGTPIGPREAMLRNLVRVADALPGLYLVGAVSVLVDRRFRRLGDLVAGTLVVREVRMESPPPGVAITPPLLPTEQLLLPRHRRVTPRDRRALEEWLATSERFGLVWSEWVAARVVDDFAKRYRITGGRAVRTLQRLVGAARAAQPELERAAGVGQDQAARLRQVLNNVAGRRVTAHDAPDLVWRLRAVVAELGRLRDVAPSRARAAEELAWEAESLLHRAGLAGRVGGVGAVYTFLFTEFPAALRRNRGWFLVASACFFGPFVGVGFGAWFDEEFARRLVSPGMRASLDEWYRNPESRTAGQNATMAGFYVFNNVGIALRAAGAGVLFGLGTGWVLITNGITLGAYFGYATRSGYGDNLLRYASGHSAWELTAIVVAGTAGLRLGAALVAPGSDTRAGSLRRAGPDVARLAGGAAAMLVVAASIEGFWSGTLLPDWVKITFALLQFGLMVLWLGGWAGRRR